MTPTVESPATGFDWVLPPGATGATETLVTSDTGTVQFQWEPTPEAADSTATVTESFADQPGFEPGRAGNDWECELRDEFGNVREVTGELEQTGPDEYGFTLDPIGQEIVTCTVWNSFEYEPAIELTKVNDPTSVRGDLTPAARVTSSYEVTNPGNTSLRGVDVADDQCDPEPVLPATRVGVNIGDTNGNGLLDPLATSGEVWEFQCDRPIRAQSTDPDGATVVNNAVAIGFDPEGTLVEDEANDDVVAWNPAIDLVKLVDGEDFVEVDPGTEVTYTYDLINTGNTPLGSITLLDDTPPCEDPAFVTGDTNGNSLLDPDPDGPGLPLQPETWSYRCTAVVSEQVVNTADVSGEPLNPLDANNPFPDPNPEVTATDDASVDIIAADILLEKSVTPELIVLDESGTAEQVVYTYMVTNVGEEYLARPGAAGGGPGGTEPGWILDNTCDPVTYVSGDDGDELLAPDPDGDGALSGESWEFTCETVVGEPTVNRAAIEAQPTDDEGTPLDTDLVSDGDIARVDVLVPAIIIEKISLVGVVLDDDSTPDLGPDVPDVRPAKYTYDVGNIGAVPLRVPDGQPVDDLCAPLVYQGGDNDGNGLLDPGEVWAYTCERPLDREEDSNNPPVTGKESGTVRNTASVEGIPVYQEVEYPDKTVDSFDEAGVLVIEPGIDIVKSASAAVVLPGRQVTYTYVVSNTGDVGLDVVGPVDDECRPLVYVEGDDNDNGLLDGVNSATPEEWTYTCRRAVYDTDEDGRTVNTVDVGGLDPLGNLFVAEDTAEVRVIEPAIDLDKNVDRTLVPAGSEVTYTFDVTNSGTSPVTADDALANVITVDGAFPAQPECAPLTFLGGDDNNNGLLDREPAEVWQYTCTATVDKLTVDVALTTGLGGTDIDPDDPIRVYDLDSAAVQVFVPEIEVVKAAEPKVLLGEGEVTYTYEVTNDGDVPLADVESRIVDDTCSPVTYVSGDDDEDGLLDTPNSIFEDAADETWIFECTTTITETTQNVVEVTGTPSESDGTPLCGEETPPGRIIEPCDVTDEDDETVRVVEPGRIIVDKVVHPEDSTEEFDFSLTDSDDFSVPGGESETIAPLWPGDYTLREAVPDGWALYDLACDDPSEDTTVRLDVARARIPLAEGETVTCTYTNVKLSAIVIRKVTDPADTEDIFSFSSSASADFEIGTGEEQIIADLAPGDYTVTEAVPDDWKLTDLVCDDVTGDTTTDLAAGEATVVLGLDEIVYCTFTNTQRGTIVVTKEADPADTSDVFAFEVVGETVELGAGESTTVTDLLPGDYEISETLPDGWSLSDLECDDPSGNSTTDRADAAATVTLDGVETVECTFSNTKGELPTTGSNATQRILLIAAALLLVGVALWGSTRRRRRPDPTQ